MCVCGKSGVVKFGIRRSKKDVKQSYEEIALLNIFAGGFVVNFGFGFDSVLIRGQLFAGECAILSSAAVYSLIQSTLNGTPLTFIVALKTR